MSIPEHRLAFAVEEELATFGGGDVTDAAVDIEGVLDLVGIAALAHPIVANRIQRQRAFFIVAVGFQIGELGRLTELAVVRIAKDPGIAEGGRGR